MKRIDTTILDELTGKAKVSPRKRMNYNLHPGPDDPVQRLCNAIEPETYIRPHRHTDTSTFEVFLMLRGAAILLFFDDSGLILEQHTLSSRGPLIAAEIPPKTWHAMASLENGTIFFEVKRGPYVPLTNKDVAAWAPAEGTPEASAAVAWYASAKTGDVFPDFLRAG